LERYFKSQEEPSGSQGEREKRFEVNLKRRRRRRRREGERERVLVADAKRERPRESERAREADRATSQFSFSRAHLPAAWFPAVSSSLFFFCFFWFSDVRVYLRGIPHTAYL
jgi:hypothetical protein